MQTLTKGFIISIITIKKSRHYNLDKMEIQNDIKINKSYLYSTVLLMFVLPIISILIDFWLGKQQFYLWMLIGKWFIFWAIGMRLLTAGLKQTITPSFTAQQIFHISDKKSYAIVRELGFANICFGTVGIISLFVPQWRIVAAFAGGLFLGIAGVNHIIRKPFNSNEMIPMVSNLFIFFVMLIYVLNAIL